MDAAAPRDKQHHISALFRARLRTEVKALVTPELIDEHRRDPLGRHSDALERVLNFFRRPPSYALYSRNPMREWQIIRLPVALGAPLQPVDTTVYRDERDAYHAVFVRHLDDLMAQ